MNKQPEKAMILAAGMGRRLRPLTDDKPKALVSLGGKTLLELVIRQLKNFGIRAIIINVHHHAQQIIDFVKRNNSFGLHIEFSFEERLLNTGGGLKKARWFFEDSETFLLHNVDVLTDMNYQVLFAHLRSTHALAALAVRKRKTNRYLLFDAQMRLTGWQNIQSGKLKIVRKIFPAFRPFAFSGIQALRSKIFEFFPEQDVFSLIDVYLQLAYRSYPIVGVVNNKDRWLDVGKPETLHAAEQIFADFFVDGVRPQ